jgi:malate dehydrogenase
LKGEAGIVECAFVDSQVLFSNPLSSLIDVLRLPFHTSFNSGTCLQQVTELPFFAAKVRLGRGGAEEIYQLGPLNEYERYYSSL